MDVCEWSLSMILQWIATTLSCKCVWYWISYLEAVSGDILSVELLLLSNTKTQGGRVNAPWATLAYITQFSVFFALFLPDTHMHFTSATWVSECARSLARYCLLPSSHYLPASLPPLTFSDTEKITPPLPSLLSCFCPPFSTGRKTPYPFYSFLPCFTIMSPVCTSQSDHSGSISISTLSSLLSCCMFSSASLSFNHRCWCCSAASTEKLVLPTNPLHAASPSLFIVHSITLPPSLPFSLSITPCMGTHFFFFVLSISCCFPLHLPLPIFIYVFSFASLTVILCAFLLHHHTSQPNGAVIGRSSLFCIQHVRGFLKTKKENLFSLIFSGHSWFAGNRYCF